MSHGVPIRMVSAEGAERTIPRLRFTIPVDSNTVLDDHWIVLTHHLSVEKTANNPYGIAWTYTHLDEALLRNLRRPTSR
jgi:hypothetical protein